MNKVDYSIPLVG